MKHENFSTPTSQKPNIFTATITFTLTFPRTIIFSRRSPSNNKIIYAFASYIHRVTVGCQSVTSYILTLRLFFVVNTFFSQKMNDWKMSNLTSATGKHAPRSTTQTVSGKHNSTQHLLMQLREIIDSRIRFVELQTRRLLYQHFLADTAAVHDYQLPPKTGLGDGGMPWHEIPTSGESSELFDYIESLSRALYVLERIKLSISEHNVGDVLQMLEDQRLLLLNDEELARLLHLTD
jgi:hypothetical protein